MPRFTIKSGGRGEDKLANTICHHRFEKGKCPGRVVAEVLFWRPHRLTGLDGGSEMQHSFGAVFA
jgi:hypothetical protein